MKERRVVFSLEAQEDLLGIYDWVASKASPTVAIGYLDRIEGFCASLKIGAERGTRRDDIRPGLRTLGFERRITIAFMVEDHKVVILRLFYGGQNWEPSLSTTN